MTDTRERVFRALLARTGIPKPEAEFRFHPTRRWRFDFAWPSARVALEVDGGVWVRGKHGRGTGIVQDHAKRNEAAVMGWRVLVVQPRHLATLATVALIARALGAPEDT